MINEALDDDTTDQDLRLLINEIEKKLAGKIAELKEQAAQQKKKTDK